MFTEHVSSVYYKHHIKHRTFFLTMRFFIDVLPILNDAIFLSMFEKNIKHRAIDASNDVIAHPYLLLPHHDCADNNTQQLCLS